MKETFKRHSRLFVVAGFALFYFIFTYTANSILEGGVEIEEDRREEETAENIRDVDVHLVVPNGNSTGKFTTKGTSNDTVGDLLNRFRDDGFLVYEQIEYTYGVELLSVNGYIAPEGYKWNVYDGEDLLKDFTKHKLSDDAVYSVKLEFVSE